MCELLCGDGAEETTLDGVLEVVVSRMCWNFEMDELSSRRKEMDRFGMLNVKISGFFWSLGMGTCIPNECDDGSSDSKLMPARRTTSMRS